MLHTRLGIEWSGAMEWRVEDAWRVGKLTFLRLGAFLSSLQLHRDGPLLHRLCDPIKQCCEQPFESVGRTNETEHGSAPVAGGDRGEGVVGLTINPDELSGTLSGALNGAEPVFHLSNMLPDDAARLIAESVFGLYVIVLAIVVVVVVCDTGKVRPKFTVEAKVQGSSEEEGKGKEREGRGRAIRDAYPSFEHNTSPAMSSAADLLQQIILEDRSCFDFLEFIAKPELMIISVALWLVDFFDTLTMEIEAAWKGRMTGTAIIFIVNRYAFAGNLIVQLVFQKPGLASNKTSLYTALSWLSITALVATNLLFSLRIYALCGRNKVILTIGLIMIIARLAVDTWATLTQALLIAQIVVVVMPLLFDSYVFGVTLFKTYHQAKEMRELKQRSITELLLRDGTTLVVFAVSAANLALNLISLNENTSDAVYLLSSSLTPYFAVALGEPAFAQNRFLGNIGEPLDPDWWNTQFDHSDDTAPDGNMADASETTDIRDRNTTLVPVVYGGGSQGEIEMVPLQREPPVAGLSSSSADMA
ncbi:uncharacterized protein STEHIDRAFT_111971 [Stereum hirsutum FP-91666 SS1]|uniref:uncharacterized protein n=1 Tax=Stereum hirsutum (strain FP-91666) TaxID=721885 RepID=UPI0004449B9A|nr:uncharacterized protein STEHIDRAFT_111971 [Stereum hirsutum FP-91666 SS1]EIM85378.1 hypothetical protein STEHIDRAFT_111971 [Stereum hirsutum FP-91666 SS1]